MARTYEDLITEARQLLQDAETPYRFSDEYMVNTLNRGLQELGRIRPDAYHSLYDANNLNVPEISATDDVYATLWSEDFELNMMFYTPLVAYVVGSIELTEDEFTVDGRAMTLLAQFRNGVLGI